MKINYYVERIKDGILKQGRVNFLSLIAFLSFIKCLALFFVIEIMLTPGQKIGYFPDSQMYERLADNLSSGHGFSLSTVFPFIPTMYKEPLYPIFIALTKSLFHSSIDIVIFIQMLLNPLIAILIYLIGRELFNEKIARLSSFIIALIPVYGEISFFFLPENIFTILLLTVILCLIKAIKSWDWVWFILSGLFLGLSSLSRNATLPLFLLYPIVILFKYRANIRKGLFLKLFIFIFSFSIITVPWMARNQKKLGLFSISRRGGEIFSHGAFWAANFSAKEWKAYSLYLISGTLAQRLYPQIIGNDLGNYEYSILMRVSYLEELLKKYREGEAEKALIFEGIKNVLHHPFRYLLLNAVIYLQTFKYFESTSLMLMNGPTAFSWVPSLLRFILFIICIFYTLIAWRGLFYSRKMFDSFLLLTTIIYFHIVLTAVGIIPGGLQRHILPITIFYSFFVVIAIDKEDARTISKTA